VITTNKMSSIEIKTNTKEFTRRLKLIPSQARPRPLPKIEHNPKPK
jgi:hypothetical protein